MSDEGLAMLASQICDQEPVDRLTGNDLIALSNKIYAEGCRRKREEQGE